ncbi:MULTISPECIES: hypothetical protein [unclassified Paraburkholderia]|uniref:hypothetical protein n=1 Tax=unclassified Paraburkholderia TaxID=2615204 RepID=UPI00183B9272|nr:MULTISPECIES: hypothetical protein [unclassified Paraburkholderia]MBB5441808.1 putative DNA-binding transcriptional regulator AlpA [Paraburkholderia sp. WSM4177]MBB5482204.1 putative DNA-binding transcriptional regulator AlpA [Paraburkholderia sp. WSM4180]
MRTLLTVDQLAKCLHKSIASIRSDATRNPRSLPPICRLPNTKRLLWRAEDVEQWLAKQLQEREDRIMDELRPYLAEIEALEKLVRRLDRKMRKAQFGS